MLTLFFLLNLLSLASGWTTITSRPFVFQTLTRTGHSGDAPIHAHRSVGLQSSRLDYHHAPDYISGLSSAWELPTWLRRLRKRSLERSSSKNDADDVDGPTPTMVRQMPWTKTFRQDGQKLTYMPFRNWQIEFMKENLMNLNELPVTSCSGRDMSYKATATHRIHTACYESNEYKLIRLTTLDAGRQAQVFTSLWYPRDSLVPVLGIDLLQFGQKTLCIVDFQPVTNDRPDEQAAIEREMAKIRMKYPTLQSQMTDRFYSASDTYFSKQMLLGRHDASVTDYTAEELVHRDLFPAFQQYVRLHSKLVNQAERNSHDLHASYDTYSAARDPAHHLLAKIFGQEWADEYVYDILFPAAQKA